MAASSGNNRNSFMGSPEAQVAMYLICIAFCVFYAVGGIRELMSIDPSSPLVQSIGESGYVALTVCRVVVLLITGGAFARVAYKVHRKKYDDK